MLVEFTSTYYDGRSAKAHTMQARWNGVDLQVTGEGLDLLFSEQEWELQPPLGRTRRVFRLKSGARLETDDLQAIETVEQALGLNSGMRWVHAIEHNWKWVLLGFVVLGGFLFSFFRFGLPVVAQKAAEVTPVSVLVAMSDNALKLLERQYLQSTRIPAARQQKIESGFQKIVQSIGGDYPYKLHFYRSSLLGANAFALPSGDIVVTDNLIKLAKNDREILGVLAHEIGHVTERHGLKSIYQSLGVFFMISVAFGDVVSPTSLAASVPALLIQNGYSRAFEAEADQVAGKYMLAQGWGTEPLQTMLQKLVEDHEGSETTSLLSTHPGVQDRLKMLQQMKR
ncbi:M48 family metallopeptidase [Deinococcus cellulosilyticus]|uniref:Uncharacterized protein n=1 Tax=Deinococcus cellulosilyticus (strain DSM 18568 / NBRC 106333 / KACC 11606 / 5516J-15) TaxID=1223518 RepID=A0A511MXY3_DEIC1|nr:M48 family metallopeptidase [Deinococcus cellulosilyticus]GEM45452.1 hypothetical protein DC3_10870 [Deinococcus cellulosilyticus NBRC 106333 = KACC 11606]